MVLVGGAARLQAAEGLVGKRGGATTVDSRACGYA